MLNLTDRKWEAFAVEDIFDIKAGKRLTTADMDTGNLPFIGATELNNGITNWINTPNETLDHNVLGVNYNGSVAETFYHPYNCVFSDDVKRLHLKNADDNKYTLLFCSIMIRKQKNKYTYGYKFNGKRMAKQKILLPITDAGSPDYAFMEDYVRELMSKKREQYLDYCKEQLKFFGGGYTLMPLADKEWKAFFIVDIFDEVQRGKRLKTADHLAGEIPYVSSSSLNNGVDDFVSNNNGVRRFSNCLSLANSGSVGSSFYEPFEFVASDHITHLKNKGFNKYHYLFLATMTSRLSQKYNFNREINDKRIAREIIFLPITDNGTPDYTYMEKYSKNLLREKIQRYIKYVEC